jgi:GTP-binding protein YchF
MKIAITGFANSGKTTIFNALTGQNLPTTVFQTMAVEPNIGIVRVPDSRLDRLSKIYMPKKTTHATVEYVDYMGLTKGDPKQNRKVFDLIHDADAILHVVRAFKDDSVSHPMGGVDALRDIEAFELEIIFGDLELVTKRLERLDQSSKKGQRIDEREKNLLLKCEKALEAETPLRDIDFTEDELKGLRHLQFLSIKPEVVLINIAEEDLNSESLRKLTEEIEGRSKGKKTKATALCGKVEMEIAELKPEDAKAFLDDLGIAEPALYRVIHVSYDLLGLISFITVGTDEVRAWTVKRGTSALEAAGKIHSDIERGFIRAEVVSYEDFMKAGGMVEARDKGLLRLEGKTYEVKDGDIINFRFNV